MLLIRSELVSAVSCNLAAADSNLLAALSFCSSILFSAVWPTCDALSVQLSWRFSVSITFGIDALPTGRLPMQNGCYEEVWGLNFRIPEPPIQLSKGLDAGELTP